MIPLGICSYSKSKGSIFFLCLSYSLISLPQPSVNISWNGGSKILLLLGDTLRELILGHNSALCITGAT